MTVAIRDNADQSRYEVVLDGELVGVADYRVVGDVVVIPHTEISPSRRGQGLAAQLVQYALDDVRAANRRVDPQCWYVADFIAAHPEYADLTR